MTTYSLPCVKKSTNLHNMCKFLLIKITHPVKICVNLTTYCTFCAQILQFVWACENVVHNLRCLVKTNTQLTKILCHRRSWQLQWVWCLPGDFWYFFEIIILFWMEWKSNYYITLHIQNSPFPRPSQQGGSRASFAGHVEHCWSASEDEWRDQLQIRLLLNMLQTASAVISFLPCFVVF